MACVYKHIRLDTNEPFYIGIGKDMIRPYSHKRSKYWKKIVKKHGYEVVILFDNITREEACLKEIELILLYGRLDLNTGTLVNMTDGGEGSVGYKHSEESLLKISATSKGRIKSPEQIEKWKNNMTFTKSPEMREKIRESLLNKLHTEERKLNQSKAQTGKKLSEETKLKISLFHKGKKKKPVLDETRQKMSDARNKYVEANRQFECQKSITSEIIINEINNLIN